MREAVKRWRIAAGLLFGRPSTLLRDLDNPDDLLMLHRQRKEHAESLLKAVAFQEVIQDMNEGILQEIAGTRMLGQKSRDMLYLKLQLVSDISRELMKRINQYEQLAMIREVEKRRA